jgi:hypothetical protein
MRTLEKSESETILSPSVSDIRVPLRILADQAFSRAAGAPLIGGNTARILKDAKDNYSQWLAFRRMWARDDARPYRGWRDLSCAKP